MKNSELRDIDDEINSLNDRVRMIARECRALEQEDDDGKWQSLMLDEWYRKGDIIQAEIIQLIHRREALMEKSVAPNRFSSESSSPTGVLRWLLSYFSMEEREDMELSAADLTEDEEALREEGHSTLSIWRRLLGPVASTLMTFVWREMCQKVRRLGGWAIRR